MVSVGWSVRRSAGRAIDRRVLSINRRMELIFALARRRPKKTKLAFFQRSASSRGRWIATAARITRRREAKGRENLKTRFDPRGDGGILSSLCALVFRSVSRIRTRFIFQTRYFHRSTTETRIKRKGWAGSRREKTALSVINNCDNCRRFGGVRSTLLPLSPLLARCSL